MTDTLDALAERCEQATGPDRELDGAIHFEVVLGEPCPANIARLVQCTEMFEEEAQTVASYTSSLDAALTLVPEGWLSINQEQQKLKDGSIRCWASIDAWPASPKRCATPALALCAAALKARAAIAMETGTAIDSEAGVVAKP